MFTGLVQHLGSIDAIEETEGGRRLSVEVGKWAYEPDPGDSIAVDGCCLTVVGIEGTRHHFDVVHRTLEMTTLGGLEAGAPVNLEPAARMDSLLGGHLVQGHIDGVGEVIGVQSEADWRVRFSAPAGVREYLCDRGSITVNGVSLTIAKVFDEGFEVALIPVTLEETNLRHLATGGLVNLEADCMAKMVAEQVRRYMSSQ